MSEPSKSSTSQTPLISLLIFYVIGGLIAVIGITLAIVSLNKLHRGNDNIATHYVPTIAANQEAISSLKEAKIAMSNIMSIDKAEDFEQISAQEATLRRDISKINVLLTAIAWGSESEAFAKSDGGLNKIEWQRLGFAKKYDLKPGSEDQAKLAGRASINFAVFAKNANRAIIAHKQELRLNGMSYVDNEIAVQNSQMNAAKQQIFAEETSVTLDELAKNLDNEIAAQANYSRLVWSSNSKALAFLALLAFFGSVIIGMAFAQRHIIKPLLNLQKSFVVIANGQLNDAATAASRGPLTVFVNSFNNMLISLRKRFNSLETELTSSQDVIKKQTQSYDQTKQAMINLLQDARSLEDELKKEKASVENKVIERTNELQKEQTRLAASVNSLSAGFIMTDSEKRVILMNPIAQQILFDATKPNGQTPSFTEVQKSFDDLLNFADYIKHCLKDKKTIERPELLFGRRFLHLYFTPIIDEGAQAIGVVVLIQDVTEEKVLQRSKDEFFSIASHELRTPLTAIRGNTTMIKQYYGEKLKDPQLKEMVNDIHDSSVRLIEIVNDFLDASRLEQGKVEFKKDRFNVDKIIESVIYEMDGVSREKGVYIKTDNSLDKLPEVCADKDKVKQIVYNMVGNAMKFTEKGGITIAAQAEKGFLKVNVIDTGKGIPADKQSLLFRKFQQASESLFTRDTTRGTGLGLYISKLLVEKMGGKINLEKSEEGKGSVFSFTLPLAKETKK